MFSLLFVCFCECCWGTDERMNGMYSNVHTYEFQIILNLQQLQQPQQYGFGFVC